MAKKTFPHVKFSLQFAIGHRDPIKSMNSMRVFSLFFKRQLRLEAGPPEQDYLVLSSQNPLKMEFKSVLEQSHSTSTSKDL